MKPWLQLVLIVLLVVVGAEVALRMDHRSRRSAPERGVAAPALALRDVDGNQVTLQGLRGKVVAVNFWATWCGPCRGEIPELARVYAEHRGKCFELLGVAEESGSRDAVMQAAQKLGINYPVLLDDDGRVGDAFRVRGYPNTFLIDVHGRVRGVFEGAIDRDEVERALAPLLAEAPAACPRV